MPHKTKTTYDHLSPDPNSSASSFFDSDSLKTRRTSASLSNLSPGKSPRHRNSISIQDLMGGEKKATDIHSGRGSRSSLVTNSAHSSPTVIQAEDKIHNILEARKTRERRRSDIFKSVDNVVSPMLDPKSPRSFNGLPNGLENLTIPLNDVDSPKQIEREGGRRRRRSSIGGKIGMSPGRFSRRHSDQGEEQRMHIIKALEMDKQTDKKGFLTTPLTKSPSSMKRTGSTTSIREKIRQRLQGANSALYCDLNGSDHSVSQRDEDDCTVEESEEFVDFSDKPERSRSKSNIRQRRSRSKSSNRISRKETESGEGEDPLKKTRSKSKNKIRSKSKQKRRSSIKLDLPETEDETSIASTSITSKSTISKKKRRPKNLVDESDHSAPTDAETPISSKSFGSTCKSPRSRKGRKKISLNTLDSSISSTESHSTSPGSHKKNKKRSSKVKRSSLEKSGEEDQSLGFLLESDRSKNRSIDKDNLSQVTEEKSITSNEPQPILLQFDPTMGNHVRSVDQNQAKKTSESIHGLHGNLEIAELAGLPTFEKLNTSSSTGTTEECLSLSAHDDSTKSYFSKKQRSASMVSPATPSFQAPGEDPFEGGGSHNAQWDFEGNNSAREIRTAAGEAGKNLFFNKKPGKAMRRSSDIGARTSSLGAMMGIRARYKSSGYDDGELLLKY